MGEAEIEELAQSCLGAVLHAGELFTSDGHFKINEDNALSNLRATLSRAPVAAWPEPKPEPEWIDWSGGECPVPAGLRTELSFRCGDTSIVNSPEHGCWQHLSQAYDVVRYRILGEQP